MKKNEKTGLLVPLLFAVYLALLIWIILFKLEFSISVLKTNRSINLIPFYYENEIGMGFHLKEVLENAVIFIPLGIYLCIDDKFDTGNIPIYFGSWTDGCDGSDNKYLWRNGWCWSVLAVCKGISQ